MQIPYNVEERPDTGLYNAKLGIWLFLASVVMLFGSHCHLKRTNAEPRSKLQNDARPVHFDERMKEHC